MRTQQSYMAVSTSKLALWVQDGHTKDCSPSEQKDLSTPEWNFRPMLQLVDPDLVGISTYLNSCPLGECIRL